MTRSFTVCAFNKAAGKRIEVDAQLFARAKPALRQAIEREGEVLGHFLAAHCDVRVRAV